MVSQSSLDYLPEPHTDFVFATMAEEWGLVGGLFVLLIFGLILRWGLTVAREAEDRFSRLLAGGMVATIFFYAAVNLLMVMGMAPVVGIPLPFMSHGGSFHADQHDLRGHADDGEPLEPAVGCKLLADTEETPFSSAGQSLLDASPRFAVPRKTHRNGRIAQLVEQLTLNQRVLGSSPSASTIPSHEINGLPALRGCCWTSFARS